MSFSSKSKFSPSSFGPVAMLLLLLPIVQCSGILEDAPPLVVRSKRQINALPFSIINRGGSSGMTPYHGDQIVRRWGRIAVGTPAKEFRVAFNMESSDLWLIHPNASISEFIYSTMPMVSPKVRYDSSQSSSSSAPQPEQTFISSSGASGKLERDNITVAGVSVPRGVRFGAAIDGIPKDFIFQSCYTQNCNFDVDGMFGLAPGPPAYSNSSKNSILRQMTRALKEPVVTISSKGLKDSVGAITFGGVDSENCDPNGYEFVPLAEPRDKWATNLLEIRIGNVSINATGNKLKFVDHSDLAHVPTTLFHAIGSAFGAKLASSHSLFYRFPKLKGDIVLVIGGEQKGQQKSAEIVLKQADYIYQGQFLRFIAEEPEKYTNNDTFHFTAPLMVNRCIALNWQEGSIAVSTAKNATSTSSG